MSETRFKVVEKALSKKPVLVKTAEERFDRLYAKHVFDREKMFRYLPKEILTKYFFIVILNLSKNN